MAPKRKPYDLAPPLRDEDLILFVQEVGWQPAKDALLAQHWPCVARHAAGLARSVSLASEDAEEFLQTAFLLLEEAIGRWDVLRYLARQGCSFPTYACGNVEKRFRNFVRSLRRQARHIDRSVTAADVLDGKATRGHGDRRPSSDPAILAEEQKRLARLKAALQRLDATEQRLWEYKAEGRSLHDAAEALGLSYDKTKRLFRKSRKQLQAMLGDLAED